MTASSAEESRTALLTGSLGATFCDQLIHEANTGWNLTFEKPLYLIEHVVHTANFQAAIVLLYSYQGVAAAARLPNL
jgi:hypothetical protein